MAILGHDKIIKYLEKSLASNSLAHAYLFSGPESVGKFQVAFEFAKKLVLSDEKTINPDIMVLKPEIEEKKGVKRKKDIKIGSVRELERELSLSAYRGGYRMAIIDDAESLTRSAQSALLKTLEEPPKKSIIILVTQDRGKILPTIISRCQEVKFNLVADQEVRKFIPKNHPKTEQILFWSMNRPGLAKEFIDNPKELEEREKELRHFKNIFSSNVNDLFVVAQEMSKDIVLLQKKLQLWTFILRSEEGFSKFFLIEKIEESLKIIRETNASPRLVMENLFLDIVSISKN